MRPLTKLEKKLIFALAGTIFVLVNLWGISSLMKQRRTLQLDAIALRGQRDDSDVYLLEKSKWLTRQDWLKKTLPASSQADAAQSTFFEDLQKSARARNLAINDQGFGEVAETANFLSVAVHMKTTGTLENTTRWLASIQSPELFQAITRFSLKSEKDPTNVNLDLEIAKYYHPTNAR